VLIVAWAEYILVKYYIHIALQQFSSPTHVNYGCLAKPELNTKSNTGEKLEGKGETSTNANIILLNLDQ